eukprot:12497059-Alexandrium_andersonii.AAC.1
MSSAASSPARAPHHHVHAGRPLCPSSLVQCGLLPYRTSSRVSRASGPDPSSPELLEFTRALRS